MIKKETLTLRIFSVLRTIALLITLSAIFIMLAWNFLPKWIVVLDNNIVSLYTMRSQLALDKAKAELPVNNEKAILKLENLLDKLSSIEKGDRLAPQKRKALDLLTKVYLQVNKYEQAIDRANDWISFDQKDLYAHARLANIIYQIDGRQEEALELFLRLYKKVPEVEFISKQYVKALIEQGQNIMAFRVLADFLELHDLHHQFRRPWQIYWSFDTSFESKNSKVLAPIISNTDRSLELSMSLPVNITKLRLDPPENLRYSIQNPRISWDNGEQEIKLSSMDFKFNDLFKSGDRLISTDGDDPYFFWDMPEYARKIEGKISFLADINISYPIWILSMMSDIDNTDIEETIRNESHLYRGIYSELKKQVLSSHELINLPVLKKFNFSIFWSNEESHFSQKRTSNDLVTLEEKGEKDYFESVLPINAIIKKLRIDFPGNIDSVYTLDEVSIFGEQTQKKLVLESSKFILMHNLIREGNTFRVTGHDPHFAIEIEEVEVSRVKVQGYLK